MIFKKIIFYTKMSDTETEEYFTDNSDESSGSELNEEDMEIIEELEKMDPSELEEILKEDN